MLADKLNKQVFTKLAVRLLILVVFVVIGVVLFNYVSSGTLTVTADSSTSSITVSSLPPQQQGSADRTTAAFTRKGTGSLTVHVHSGTYFVFAQNGNTQTGQTVKVGWLAHVHITITTAKLTTTEPVLYENAQNLAADNTHMIYLNGNSNQLENINSQNIDTPLSADQKFTSVAWANPSYGVAQDSSGNLYVFNGSSLSPLKTPLTGASNLASTTFAVAPDKTIYIGYGSYVYRGTDNGDFSTIYRNFAQGDSLVAANDRVLVITPNTGNATGGMATVIDKNDKTITKGFGYSLGGWSPWSANGNYIVITVGSVTELFDATLKQVGTVPEPNGINGGAWLGDNTLYYASGNQLCAYDVSKSTSSLVATMPDNDSIQAVTASTDGAYIYTTAATSSSDATPGAVFRVGLRGQTVSNELTTLQDVLPITSSTYSVGLRNFTGTPTITVTAFPGTDPNDALQSAQDAVQGMINVNDVTFDVESGD